MSEESYFGLDAAIESLEASRFDLFMARIFGKKVIARDSSLSESHWVKVSLWRGKIYLLDSGEY